MLLPNKKVTESTLTAAEACFEAVGWFNGRFKKRGTDELTMLIAAARAGHEDWIEWWLNEVQQNMPVTNYNRIAAGLQTLYAQQVSEIVRSKAKFSTISETCEKAAVVFRRFYGDASGIGLQAMFGFFVNLVNIDSGDDVHVYQVKALRLLYGVKGR